MLKIAYIKPCTKCNLNCPIDDEQTYYGEAVTKVKASLLAGAINARIIEEDEEFYSFCKEIKYSRVYLKYSEGEVKIVPIARNPTILIIDSDNTIYTVDISSSFSMCFPEIEPKVHDLIEMLGVKRVLQLGYEELWEEIEKLTESETS